MDTATFVTDFGLCINSTDPLYPNRSLLLNFKINGMIEIAIMDDDSADASTVLVPSRELQAAISTFDIVRGRHP